MAWPQLARTFRRPAPWAWVPGAPWADNWGELRPPDPPDKSAASAASSSMATLGPWGPRASVGPRPGPPLWPGKATSGPSSGRKSEHGRPGTPRHPPEGQKHQIWLDWGRHATFLRSDYVVLNRILARMQPAWSRGQISIFFDYFSQKKSKFLKKREISPVRLPELGAAAGGGGAGGAGAPMGPMGPMGAPWAPWGPWCPIGPFAGRGSGPLAPKAPTESGRTCNGCFAAAPRQRLRC